MNIKKTLRILGLALIFSLLVALVPATPAFAYDYDFEMSPSSGQTGDEIDVSGADWPPSTESNEGKYVIIIFSDEEPSTYVWYDDPGINYEKVQEAEVGWEDDNDEGEWSTSFDVPDELTDGEDDVGVEEGTYYVGVGLESTAGDNIRIYVVEEFEVEAAAAAAISISPTSGLPGTAVTVTGSHFTASRTLTFKLDGTTITATSGSTSTTSSGTFSSILTIPSTATAGSHTITATAGSTVSSTFTVTSNAAITLSPTTGAAGSSVVITGTAFPVNTILTFLFDSTPVTPTGGNTGTNTSGGFTSTITVPSTATNGGHIITVTAGTKTLTAAFTVTGSATPTETTTPTGTASLKLATAADTIGAQATLFGFDFTAGSTVVITYDGAALTTTTADADGFVSVTFTVPAGKYGAHTITATDGVNSGTYTFTVESTAPEVPQPNSPSMGAAVKSPPTFDWNDVTDLSAPVTYKLQIATSTDFAANSIVLDKTGIVASGYTLTDAEASQLTGDVTYYWREKAVDAAQNESAWTGAGEFTISQPFEFTGWPLYLTIGVGAVLMFLLGLWIGRRTAFYY